MRIMILRLRDGFLVSIAFLCFPRDFIIAEWSPLTPNSSSIDSSASKVIVDESQLVSHTFLHELRWLVESGKLSSARSKALDGLQNPSITKSDITKVYVETFKECYDAGGNEYLRKIKKSIDTDGEQILNAKKDSPNCSKIHSDWSITDPYELWDESCSILPSGNSKITIRPDNDFSLSSSSLWQCCEFSPGSWTYLRLPVIHEPAVRLGIPFHRHGEAHRHRSTSTNSTITYLSLEQDGYLRPFDVAGILWPTGYMLSLCLGDLVGCPIPELHVLITQHQQNDTSEGTSNQNGLCKNYPPLALELGAGIGASSIALAKSLQRMGFPFSSQDPCNQPWVVATDVAPQALALTIANARSNNIDLVTASMDHFNQSSVQDVKNRFFLRKEEHIFETGLSSNREKQNQSNHTGFSLVVGSSLQGLFQDTGSSDSLLWKTLDQLLDSNNPNALVILAHNRADKLNISPHSSSSYNLVRRLSASDEFFGNMKGRAGDVSDFVISVLQSRTTQCKKIIF